MTAVLEKEDNASEQTLYMGLELSNQKWKLCFSDGERSRQNTIDAGDWVALNEGQSGGRSFGGGDCGNTLRGVGLAVL
ncbi:MAG: hypothetical protein ACREEM_46720 [Blastocatellia bacterium]